MNLMHQDLEFDFEEEILEQGELISDKLNMLRTGAVSPKRDEGATTIFVS